MAGAIFKRCRTLRAVNRRHGEALIAAVYCRISLAKFGDTIKVDDQERICRNLARTNGWTVPDQHVYRDNSRSAWRHDRKRPGWDAMLEAVGHSQIQAIIVYHGDRLIRQPWDLELLLRLAREKGIRLAAPTGERDLDNPDDQYILRIEAAQACRESDNTSRRLKRMYVRMEEHGLARLGGRGGRAFGFEPDGITVRESDAEMIRDVARRILAGESVSSICRTINGQGYRTTTGLEFGHGSLKKLMLRPRLAGLLARHGTIVGKAAWPAILERGTWEAVCAVLEHRATSFAYTTNFDRRFLLSGIAVCGTCGHTLAVRQAGRARVDADGTRHSRRSLPGYGCINPDCARRVSRAIHHLDPYVEGAVVELLGDPRVRERMTAGNPGEAADLVVRLSALQVRREAVFVEFASDPELGPDVLRVTVRDLDRQIAEVRGLIGAAQVPDMLDGLWGLDADGWGRLDLPRRRAAVAALVRVTVLPAKRGPGFDPRFVRLELAGGG
jgi:site-specific DNA recombinase